uniref:Uncharacterized protein n=1 Tax=Rhizophora mucronata TaxID=61149 RepID=A0A2P2P687_RHIMU
MKTAGLMIQLPSHSLVFDLFLPLGHLSRKIMCPS